MTEGSTVRDDWNYAGKTAFQNFLGWGISTLLIWLFNRHNKKDSSSTSQQPSDYTYSNVNSLGSPIPVVIGRGMIKSPLISYYGDFDYRIYTEEYGAHSRLDIGSVMLQLLIMLIPALLTPDKVVSKDGGVVKDSGKKRRAMMSAIIQFLIWLLMQLLVKHMLRTTIQKGFKYYLGWQNLICWTGPNCGIKKIYMDVYDDKVESSTQTGVWDNDNHVAWKSKNPKGIVAHVDDEDMFGGVDEGGGFIGDIRFYFGTREQGRDSWMVDQMTKSTNIPDDLKGLTPIYHMYLTSVIPKSYIGKQATIPEMWFEVVNYPNRLGNVCSGDATYDRYNEIIDIVDDIKGKSNEPLVKDAMGKLKGQLKSLVNSYKDILQESEEFKNAINKVNLPDMESHLDKYTSMVEAAREAKQECSKTVADLYDKVTDDTIYKRLIDLYYMVDQNAMLSGKIGEDANPADAIYEILTNDYWGCGYTEDRVDIKSLLYMSEICNAQGLGVSCVINNVSKAGDYINKILNHINAVKYDDPKTGKITFKMIRNDYDIEKIKHFNMDNVTSLDFTRLDWSETTSAVNAAYTEAEDNYNTSTLTVQDIANTFITKNYSEDNIDASYFTTARNAAVLAHMRQKSSGYPLSTINFTCGRYAYDVTIGEPILVNWPPYGIEQQVYRVTDIDYGSLTEEKITITAIEDMFGFEKVDYSTLTPPVWEDVTNPPENIDRFKFLELPYEISYSLDTYIYTLAAKPSAIVTAGDIWRCVKGDYKRVYQFSNFTTTAKMLYGTSELYGEDSTGFEIVPLNESSREALDLMVARCEADPKLYNNKNITNVILCEDEFMSYQSIKKLPNSDYQLTGVIRGIYDTVPQLHGAGEAIYFSDYAYSVSYPYEVCTQGNATTEKLELTSETGGSKQAFDAANVTMVDTTRRSERPSVMANLKFGVDKGTLSTQEYNYPAGTVFAGDLSFSFLSRDKFNSYGIMSQLDSAVSVASGSVENVISVKTTQHKYELKENAQSSSGNMDFTWARYCKEANGKLSETMTVALTIHTYDTSTGLYSHDAFKKDISWAVPRLVGIVTTTSAVQSYANSIAQKSMVKVPANVYNPEQVISYDLSPLIFVGSYGGTVKAQDGNTYSLSTTCYRIDGYNESTNSAIIHKINIEDYYTILSNFTTRLNNYYVGYQYRSGTWHNFAFYSGT